MKLIDNSTDKIVRLPIAGYSCSECKHSRKADHALYCRSPNAAIKDRVAGIGYPILRGPFDLDLIREIRQQTLSRCDNEGWFEPKPTPTSFLKRLFAWISGRLAKENER